MLAQKVQETRTGSRCINMLNLEEINNTINTLESGSTTFANCEKLASLYIVREHLEKSLKSVENTEKQANNPVIKEYSDILPSYSTYIVAKRKYQNGEIPESNVIKSLQYVGKEIVEFIASIYAATDSKEERKALLDMEHDLHKWAEKLENNDNIEL